MAIKSVDEETMLADITANANAYEALRAELEETHLGEWVAIVGGEIAAIAPSYQEVLQRSDEAADNAPSRVVRLIGEELPTEIRKL